MEKYRLVSDQKANNRLRDELSELRGGMASQVEKINLPGRFEAVWKVDCPELWITDLKTGRMIQVSLCHAVGVCKALQGLFG